jgi:hypothetical protein
MSCWGWVGLMFLFCWWGWVWLLFLFLYHLYAAGSSCRARYLLCLFDGGRWVGCFPKNPTPGCARRRMIVSCVRGRVGDVVVSSDATWRICFGSCSARQGAPVDFFCCRSATMALPFVTCRRRPSSCCGCGRTSDDEVEKFTR